MRRLLLILALVLAGWPLHAQDKAPDIGKVTGTVTAVPAIGGDEIAASYRLGALAQRVVELGKALEATQPYKDYMAAVKAKTDLEAQLSGVLKQKIGKGINGDTGQLK